MNKKQIINKIAKAINEKKAFVVNLLNNNGSNASISDSNEILANKISGILASGNKKAINDISYLIYTEYNLVGFDDIAGLVGSLIGADSTKQQGQDAIALEIIKASNEQNKKSDTAIIVAIVVLVLVFALIGLVIYLKYRKK